MSIREWLGEHNDIYDNDNELVEACRKALGVTKKGVLKALKSLRTTKGPKAGMSRTEFLSNYDTDTKIRLAIRKALTEITTDQIIPDSEFRRDHCGQATPSWRSVADEPEFHTYQFRCSDKNFWAKPETVKWALSQTPRAKGL